MVFFGEKYKYRTYPEQGIAVGIHSDHTKLAVHESLNWSWAIQNIGSNEKSFLIFNDSERKRYFKLQISRDPDQAAIHESSPLLEYERERINNRITLPLAPLIIKIKPGEIHEFKISQPEFELAPGNYWLRLSFEADRFEYSSEFIPISIITPDK